MTFSMRPIIGFLTTALLAGPAFANTAATSSTTATKPIQKTTRMWSGSANISRSSSLYDFGDGSRRDGMDYMANLKLKINDAFSLSAQGGYSQDLKFPESNDFSDTSIGLQRAPREIGKTFLLGYRAGLGIPTSKDSHTRQNLLASASTGINIIINPNRLITGLEIAGSLGVGRNFHQFETALDGKVNTQYSASQSLSLSYGFASGIALAAEFKQKNTWSYQDVMRHSFEMAQEVSYQINPAWAVSGGHSNSGSTLKPNGSDSNIQVIDDNNSVLYIATTALF